MNFQNLLDKIANNEINAGTLVTLEDVKFHVSTELTDLMQFDNIKTELDLEDIVVEIDGVYHEGYMIRTLETVELDGKPSVDIPFNISIDSSITGHAYYLAMVDGVLYPVHYEETDSGDLDMKRCWFGNKPIPEYVGQIKVASQKLLFARHFDEAITKNHHRYYPTNLFCRGMLGNRSRRQWLAEQQNVGLVYTEGGTVLFKNDHKIIGIRANRFNSHNLPWNESLGNYLKENNFQRIHTIKGKSVEFMDSKEYLDKGGKTNMDRTDHDIEALDEQEYLSLEIPSKEVSFQSYYNEVSTHQRKEISFEITFL